MNINSYKVRNRKKKLNVQEWEKNKIKSEKKTDTKHYFRFILQQL